MYVKGHKKTVGIPEASIRVVAGSPEIFLANRVVVLVKRLNDGEVVSSLRLSVEEAYKLAQDLRHSADDAQRATAVAERINARKS